MKSSYITFEKHVVSKMSTCRLTFEKSCISKIRTCWLTFKKSMHFKYKYIRFSNLSLFVSGQFWVHDVLKNELFWLINKNPVLTVHWGHQPFNANSSCWQFIISANTKYLLINFTIHMIFQYYLPAYVTFLVLNRI